MKRQALFILTAVLFASLLLAACAQPGSAPEQTAAPAGEQPAATEAAGETGGETAGEPLSIRVATDATWPPFESVDEASKEIVGFDVDLLNAIAEKANLEVEYINVGFDPLLAGIAQCQYDAAISAITITDERKQSMLFSDPYFDAGQIVVVQSENTDITDKDSLSGKTVGAQIGTTGAIETENIEGATLKTYDDVGLAFQDLMNGQVDAVIADNPLALGYVAENEGRLKTAGEPFTAEQYGIAICKTNTDLQARINEGLAAVKAEGTIEELTGKWIAAQ